MSANGDKLRVEITAPLSDELVSELREAKPDLLEHLRRPDGVAADPGPGATAECWQTWYGECAAIREFDAHYTR